MTLLTPETHAARSALTESRDSAARSDIIIAQAKVATDALKVQRATVDLNAVMRGIIQRSNGKAA